MSVVVRTQLAQAATRLLKEITETKKAIDTLALEANSLLPLGAWSEKLKRSIDDCEKLLERWEDKLAQITDEDKLDREERIFTDFVVEGQSPVAIIDKAKQAQTAADIMIDRIRIAQHGGPLPTPGGGSSTAPPPTAPLPDPMPTFRLPNMDCPTFVGTDESWGPFWASFESMVHSNPAVSGIMKYNYLNMKMKGSAQMYMQGYSPSEANYQAIIKTLLDRFGDKDRLTAKLQGICSISKNPRTMRGHYEHSMIS